MSLYNDNELELFSKHVNEIMLRLDKIAGEKLDPTRKETIEVAQIVATYIKKNKRKIYGGSAINLSIKTKNPEMAFYTDDELHDMDTYSPEPIKDVIELCDILNKKGYKNVIGREAIHKETYSVAVNGKAYCDFSYVPRNVYRRIPFLEIEGFTVTHPMFMWIDYLRMFIDPLLSHRLWDKAFKRFYLMQKYYPVRQNKKQLKFVEKPMSNKLYDTVISFLKEHKSLITIGQVAYNAYVEVSKPTEKFITKIPVTEFELISTDYVTDVQNIVKHLQSNGYDKIQLQENYPFFQFTGFNSIIIDDSIPRIKIYDYNKICLPYIDHKGLRIGSFHLNLMRVLVSASHARINENKDYEQLYFEMASHEIIMRKNFLLDKNQNFLDNSIFKDFNEECIGFTRDAKIEKMEEMSITHGRGRFDYHPESGKKLDPANWKFVNSSGNSIRNIKNCKITISPDIHIFEKSDRDTEESKDEKPSIPRTNETKEDTKESDETMSDESELTDIEP